MYSGYTTGEEEQQKALQGMLIHAKNMKEQGKNFWGKELKVDPSKGKGAATTTTTKTTRLGPAMGRGMLGHERDAKDLVKPAALPSVTAAIEVGTKGLQQNLASLFERGSAEKLGMSFGSAGAAPLSIAPEVTTAAQQGIAQTASQAGQTAASTLKIGADAAATTASSGLQAAASSAMPWLLGIQFAAGLLGAKGDKKGFNPYR